MDTEGQLKCQSQDLTKTPRVFCPIESPHTRRFEGLLFVGFCPNRVCRSSWFLTPCEDDEKAMAEDELQRLTDNQSSFSASFVLHFAHSDGQRKMSVMKYGELRASWKQGSCQLNITLIKPNLSLGGFFFITLWQDWSRALPLIYVVILLQHPSTEMSCQASWGFIGFLSDTLFLRTHFSLLSRDVSLKIFFFPQTIGGLQITYIMSLMTSLPRRFKTKFQKQVSVGRSSSEWLSNMWEHSREQIAWIAAVH